jgi:hypothetical protein
MASSEANRGDGHWREDLCAALIKKALEKVLNANVLVNLVSQRVR